jgi:hypothetical protein
MLELPVKESIIKPAWKEDFFNKADITIYGKIRDFFFIRTQSVISNKRQHIKEWLIISDLVRLTYSTDSISPFNIEIAERFDALISRIQTLNARTTKSKLFVSNCLDFCNFILEIKAKIKLEDSFRNQLLHSIAVHNETNVSSKLKPDILSNKDYFTKFNIFDRIISTGETSISNLEASFILRNSRYIAQMSSMTNYRLTTAKIKHTENIEGKTQFSDFFKDFFELQKLEKIVQFTTYFDPNETSSILSKRDNNLITIVVERTCKSLGIEVDLADKSTHKNYKLYNALRVVFLVSREKIDQSETLFVRVHNSYPIIKTTT